MPLDWASDVPDYWDGPESENDYLNDDICTWIDADERLNYFVRGVLEIPIIGTEKTLCYGVWSSLSEASFERILELWNEPGRTEEPPYFGWLSNSLLGYPETLNLKVDVETPELELRPFLVLHDGDHPLITEQRDGISMDRVYEIAELHMHLA